MLNVSKRNYVYQHDYLCAVAVGNLWFLLVRRLTSGYRGVGHLVQLYKDLKLMDLHKAQRGVALL